MGADLEAGVLTLPLIRLLEISDEKARKEIIDLMSSDSRDEKLQRLLKTIQEKGALDYSFQRAQDYRAEALAQLSFFENSSFCQSLEKLLDYVLERKK